jgi:hypothetical protein
MLDNANNLVIFQKLLRFGRHQWQLKVAGWARGVEPFVTSPRPAMPLVARMERF